MPASEIAPRQSHRLPGCRPRCGIGTAGETGRLGRSGLGAGRQRAPGQQHHHGDERQAPLDLDLSRLPRQAVVDDIVYMPLETPLLAAARARGNAAVDGLGMLLHQARPGFAAWFGRGPEVDAALRDFVLAASVADDHPGT